MVTMRGDKIRICMRLGFFYKNTLYKFTVIIINWSYKTCKATVKSPPTNQHPAFYWPDALPVAQPTVSEQ